MSIIVKPLRFPDVYAPESIFTMKKSVYLPVLLSCLSLTSFAQDESDALRFSFLQPQGTARSMGVGSAMGSVGGDFTSLSVNPAGIGVYRRSEFMFTPSLVFNKSESRYSGGQSEDDNGSAFNFSNLGYVLSSGDVARRRGSSSWKAVSFGIGLNRTADFTRNYSYSGRNTTSSASEVFVQNANDNPSSLDDPSSPATLGYQSYLVNFDSVTNSYYTLADWTGGLDQSNVVRERGGISEVLLSLGGNYQEKLLIGGTLGIPTLRYVRSRTFTERDASGNTNNDFDNFSYSEDLRTSGTGLNLKFGVIYKPVNQVRLGAALHSPTWFGLSDRTNADLTANTEAYQGTVSVTADERTYDYNLTTPWRAILSGTVLMGQFGFVTLDYEYVDYKSMHYSFSSLDRDYERAINNSINNRFSAASNIRAGVEIKLDNFMMRGGMGYYGNPYDNSYFSDGSHLQLGGGIGFRFDAGFLDIAYTHDMYKTAEQPYSLSYTGVTVPTATGENSRSRFAVTAGFKF